MKRTLAVAVMLAAVVAAPRLAHAACYYTWSCSGECAPGQLAITVWLPMRQLCAM